MDKFVDVPFEVDAMTLADRAVVSLQDRWPGWEPNEGDAEVVLIETLAPMAANAARVASSMPAAALRAFAQKLLGMTYLPGTAATTTATVTLTDTDGHTIPELTEIDVDGVAFFTDADVVVPAASDTGVVALTAALTGEFANGLTGSSVQLLSSLAFVESVVLDAPTSGGSDAETIESFLDRISRELELQSTTLVTPRDYELIALSQPTIARAVAVHDGDRAVEVTLVDTDGAPVSAPIKAVLAAIYETYRLVNTVVTLSDATYTTIDVAYDVKALPGYDPVDLVARVDADLAGYLSPSSFGRPRVSGEESLFSTSWVNDPVVRRLRLVDLIGNVEGVDYVVDLTITGSAGTAEANGDWTMPGAVALPEPGAMTGSVS